MQSLLTFADSTPLHELLKQPSPRLQEVLDQENVIQEVREYNPDLLSYLLQINIFDDLISYSYQIPPNHNNSFGESHQNSNLTKLPFVATEILALGNSQIVKRFFESTPSFNPHAESAASAEDQQALNGVTLDKSDQTPIAKFLTFLDSPAPVDFTLAGYFCKVLKKLFQTEPQAVAEFLFDPLHNYVKKIFLHIYCDSMQDLFLTILKLDASGYKTSPQDHFLTERVALVEQIIACVFKKDASYSNDIAYDQLLNSSRTLCSLLGSYICFPNGKKVVAPILAQSTFESLMGGLINSNLIQSLVPLLQQVCTHYKDLYSRKDQMPLLDLIHFTECVIKPKIPDTEPFILVAKDHIENIINSIKLNKQATSLQPIQNQENIFSISPNQKRIYQCEIMLNLLKLQNSQVDAQIIENDGLSVLLDLFVTNPWNSILHHGLTKLFIFVIEHGSPLIKENMLRQGKILDFIVKESKEPEVQIYTKTGNKTKKSYIAHLNILANLLDGINDSTISNYCEGNQDWQTYKTDVLALENEKNKGISDKNLDFGSDEEGEKGSPKFQVFKEGAFSPRQEEAEQKCQLQQWEDDDEPDMTPKSSKASQHTGWDYF